MLIKELPESELLVCSSETNEIAAALRDALKGSMSVGYGHMAPISGKPFSGRVLSSRPFMDTVCFPRIFFPTEMAAELMNRLKWEARYSPEENPKKAKGWEVRRAETDDGPITIVWAKWVSARPPAMPSFI